jgi:hypothetical protein
MANSHAKSDDEAAAAADTTTEAQAAPEVVGDADDLLGTAATVGVIVVAAALIEASLIPGMIIGVGAMLVPKALPRLGSAVEPAFKGVVRGAYKLGQKARHVVAEAEEQVRDVVAEANAEAAATSTKH